MGLFIHVKLSFLYPIPSEQMGCQARNEQAASSI